MVRKKIEKNKIEEGILEIIDSSRISLSISQVTKEINDKFGIKVSPQIVKRYLLKLKMEGKIRRA